MNFAPGQQFGPFYTNFFSLSMFRADTVSGIVKFKAIERGTPICSRVILGSGDITLLAEKSTLLPIRLPLNLPSLPFNLDFKHLIALPFLCFDLI